MASRTASRGARRALSLTSTALVLAAALLAAGPATAAGFHAERCAATPAVLPGALAGACAGVGVGPQGPGLGDPLDYFTLWGCYHVYVDGWYWGIACFEPW